MADNVFIPITQKQIEGAPALTVDARELHQFLGVETPFAQWISRRIADYTFLCNRDFWEFSAKKAFGIFKRETTDYALSLDMAKELAMVERNERGRQARRYFIEAEKKLKAGAADLTGGNARLAQALTMAGGLNKRQQDMLLKSLSASVIARRPSLARLVYAEKAGLDWEELKAVEPRPARLAKAVEEALALGLIKAAPKGMPAKTGKELIAQGELI